MADVSPEGANQSIQWDVFVSHAHEDKDEIARPLAEALRGEGLRVWYDEFSLSLGDSLRRSIDLGLSKSRFGIVILSQHFFSKHWPAQELNGLATREDNQKKVILPVWHRVSFDDVRKYSPILADRVAVNSEKGLPHVVEKLLAAIPKPKTPKAAISASETVSYVRNLEALVLARTDQLQAAMSSLERSYDITLEALGDMLDLKNVELEGHSKRVTAFTIAIGRAMGLPREQLNTIGRGAFLHDIGKTAIPDNVLRKRGKFTASEAAVMREHAHKGYQLVKKIPFLAEAAEIVYSHHEKFDGSGYPRGLKGPEIPIGARIFAIADTLDDLSSSRGSFQVARMHILDGAGTAFDPEIVRVFAEMPERIWKDLADEIGKFNR